MGETNMHTTAPALPPRAAVILRVLASYWLSTTQVVNKLHTQGFTFSPDIVRAQLSWLVAQGHVARTRNGSSYYWRDKVAAAEVAAARESERATLDLPASATRDEMTPLPGPTEADVEQELADAVETIAHRLGIPLTVARSERGAPVPAPLAPITEAEFEARIADHPLENLFRLDDRLVDRIVKRAKYDALKAMLSAANGWHEGALSNHEALGHRDDAEQCCGRFAIDDIFRMVNDAARATGTTEPYREGEQA